MLVLAAGAFAYKLLAPSPVEQAVNQLEFDDSLTAAEQQTIKAAIQAQQKTYKGDLSVSARTTLSPSALPAVLAAYVPVTHPYSSKQKTTAAELSQTTVYLPADTDPKIQQALARTLGTSVTNFKPFASTAGDIKQDELALLPASQLTPAVKLLALDDAYYLDTFTTGAVFREAAYSGESADSLADLTVNGLPGKDQTLKINMSGVTALTRVMQRKLASVKDPLHFSAKIGDYLADADITHVSNEVSFRAGCAYSNTLFCSPPEFIETLKDSSVDLVEITGNHNNDNGSIYNTETINLYRSLGWSVVGGGLNSEDARKPYMADKKGSKVTFLAYNMADGAGSGAIAGSTTAGANLYTEEKATADIAAAKANSQFVIINVQYAECQAYPSGYVEFPLCDGPIGGQTAAFRKFIDLGADMVIGSSAHQPQTYEFYKDKPIFYGLGNMYFDQTQWPGTERGIILSHYFANGKLVQTKLSPTVYDRDFQTELMDDQTARYLLDRLNAARP